MARVLWSREALRNLDRIGDHALVTAPGTVTALLTSLYEATEPLIQFPRMGRVVPGFQPELRELIWDRYRIVYEIQGRTVTIISVFHASMDVENRLRDLLGEP